MIWYSLKLAYRNIIKNRHSYILNVSGLVIALTVCFLTLFYAVFEHNYEKYKFNTDNIYVVQEKEEFWNWPNEDIPFGLSDFLANNVPGVNAVIKYEDNHDFNIKIDEDKIFNEWAFHFVDSNFLRFINKTTISGNCLLRNQNDLLLTKSMALKYYNTTDCIGNQITVYNREEQPFHFTVSGVFDYPVDRAFRPEYNLIARLDIYDRLKQNFKYNDIKEKTEAFLILDKSANHEDIIEQIENYYTTNIKKDYLENRTIKLISPKEIYFGYYGKRVNTSIIISVIILLVALINFIIHSNAQFWERSKTIGVNKIVGSKPKHIFNHSFAESFIVNNVCFVLAFLIAVVIMPHTKKYLNDALAIQHLPLVSLFIIAFTVTIVISILTSLSSYFLSNRKPVLLVSQQLNKGAKGKLANSSLITLQIGVTAFLMILFLTTMRQLKYVQNMDLGFNAEEVMHISILKEDISPERFNDLKDRILSTQDVVSVANCWHVPPAGDRFFLSYTDEDGQLIEIDRNVVDYSFFSTLGINFKSGRDFDKNLDNPGQNIIVNQEFLDVKNIKNPYDTLVKIFSNSDAKKIIGVIDKYHMRGMHEKITPQLYELDPKQSRNLLVKISPTNVMQTLGNIEMEFKSVFPYMTYNMGFVEDDIQNLYTEQENFNTLISYYTIISLIIACMGLFGFVLNEMNKRIKEIGIRKVNGAKIAELFNFLNREFVVLSLIGFLIASPLALHFSQKWTENFAYKIAPAWWIFIIVAFVIYLIVFATVSIQTVRVARKNPVEALRYE